MDLENELMVAMVVLGKGQLRGLWWSYTHTAIFKVDNQQGPTV